MIHKILFHPHGPVSFRKPSSFGTLAHGPGTAGESLAYPLPSTLAGVLAGIAFQKGLCSPSHSEREWEDTLQCLEALIGGSLKLYSGLALLGGEKELRYYTPQGYMLRKDLAKYHECIHSESSMNCEEQLGAIAIREPSFEYIGIALGRDTKTVLPEHLYTTIYLDPASIKLSYVLLAKGSSFKIPLKGEVVKLGGDGKTATLRVEEIGGDITSHLIISQPGSCKKWMLQLISPALLEDTPWRRGEPIALDEDHALGLSNLLLGRTKQDIRVERLIVPKTDPTITILSPGWSMAANRPRKPHLFIPPGSLLKVHATRKAIEELVSSGLGLHTNLGWGTIIATCIG